MSSKLSIAMFSSHSCPLGRLGTRDTGGMNVYVRELSRELGKLGHRVDIYTRAHDRRHAQIESPAPGVRVIHIQAGLPQYVEKMAQYHHLPGFMRGVAAFSQQDRTAYDLVHSHYWLSGSVGLCFAREWGVPALMMFHTLGAVKNSLPVDNSESGVRLTAEKEFAASYQRIIAATESEKNSLVNLYGVSPARISIIPCGVDVKLFKPRDKAAARRELGLGQGKVILFVGRVEALKGIDRLIQAVSLLKPETDAKLLIVGGDGHSQVAQLKTLAGECGIADSVAFMGTVAQDRLPLYYSAADILVVASYYESFGMVILESLACGTPVASTGVGIAPAVIHNGENGYLVTDNTPGKLAEGIAGVLRSGPVNPAAVRRSVAGYDWPEITRMMLFEYQSLLAESKSRGGSS